MALYLWLLMYPVSPDVVAAPLEPAPVCVAFCERVCWQTPDKLWHREQREYSNE